MGSWRARATGTHRGIRGHHAFRGVGTPDAGGGVTGAVSSGAGHCRACSVTAVFSVGWRTSAARRDGELVCACARGPAVAASGQRGTESLSQWVRSTTINRVRPSDLVLCSSQSESKTSLLAAKSEIEAVALRAPHHARLLHERSHPMRGGLSPELRRALRSATHPSGRVIARCNHRASSSSLNPISGACTK